MPNATYSFWRLIGEQPIRIPMLQRDYAQGRTDAKTATIRAEFLQVLHRALAGRGAAELDFVYGSRTGGVLIPLDGQQRLTTLFLLHWYLAAADQPDASTAAGIAAELGKFEYETRASARDFCASLTTERTLAPWKEGGLSRYLQDTTWFQPAWARDPTVAGMLTMLDAIAEEFGRPTGWFGRLKTADCPITFQFLPLDEYSLTDELYLRMNARRKPLSAFENWKARFNAFLDARYPADARFADFTSRLDGAWTDLFWRNAGANKRDADPAALIDAPLLHYLDFVTRLLWLRDLGRTATPADLAVSVPFERYEAVYGREENLLFLQTTLDLWSAQTELLEQFFARLFAADRPAAVRLFVNWVDQDTPPNLFRACVERTKTGEMRASLVEQVLFFAVLEYAVAAGQLTPDNENLSDLLRVARNLLLRERWQNHFSFTVEPSGEKLPHYLSFVRNLVDGGRRNAYEVLSAPAGTAQKAFTAASLAYEQQKALLLFEQGLQKNLLRQLEDLPMFRGSIHNLDPGANADHFAAYYEALTQIWAPAVPDHLVVRALLTVGDYAVAKYDGYKRYYGSRRGWHMVLTQENSPLRTWLPAFLREYAAQSPTESPAERLNAMIRRWWEARGNGARDRRYYFVKYEGITALAGIFHECYFAWPASQKQGYAHARMLSQTSVNSTSINPYVRAVIAELKDGKIATEENGRESGSEESPLWITPHPGADGGRPSAALYYCEHPDKGWRLELSPGGYDLSPAVAAAFDWAVDDRGRTWLQAIAGRDSDRIEAAVALVQRLVEPGSLVRRVEAPA